MHNTQIYRHITYTYTCRLIALLIRGGAIFGPGIENLLFWVPGSSRCDSEYQQEPVDAPV